MNAITTEALPAPAPAPAQRADAGAPDARRARGEAEPAYVPGKRGAPPPRQSASAIASARRHAASPVPDTMVSTSMMSALDKYEAMVKERGAEGDDKDLTL